MALAKKEAPPRVLPREYEPEAPIGSLSPHPENPNAGDLGVIAESIDETGFWGDIIVQRSTRYILAGNHRWMALKAAGAATCPVAVYDVDDDDALKILLADNATAEHGKRDPGRVLSVLETIQGLAPHRDPLRGTGLLGLPGAGFLLERLRRSAPPLLGASPAAEDEDAGEEDEQVSKSRPSVDGEATDPDAGEEDERDDERWPLAIVLNRHQYRRWQEYKKRVEAKRDMDAFVTVLDALER